MSLGPILDSVEIDCDEDGWHLIIEGDLARNIAGVNFRLPATTAIQLLEEVMEKIAPWHTEGQSVLRDFEHYQRTGIKPDYLPLDADHEPNQAEALRAHADDARKRAKENPCP